MYKYIKIGRGLNLIWDNRSSGYISTYDSKFNPPYEFYSTNKPRFAGHGPNGQIECGKNHQLVWNISKFIKSGLRGNYILAQPKYT